MVAEAGRLMALSPVVIDVVSDVVCPWCYLGKHRLERALGLVPEVAAAVRWRPYRLDPTIPPEGIDRAEYVLRKFGSATALDQAHERLVAMGKAEGVTYRFERITRSPDTTDAHRLVRWAAAEDRQGAMVERLFAAYFTEGLDIGDSAVLADLGASVGLNHGAVAARLAGEDDRAAVGAEMAGAARAGVTGVPCFILDQRFGLMGAQPAETLAGAIRKAIEERGAVAAG
jgi:predicted DsbA family dithiol-disulfide isomerase